MILEWFAREAWIIPIWWLLVTLAGIAVLPLCLRLLGGLPDKGYAFARAIGMLLVGFVYWTLASYGFIANTTGGMLLAWLIVLVISLLVFFKLGDSTFGWRAYWRESKKSIILAELLFAILFIVWTVYRAHQNDTFTTEKPMEIAFISAIMRSEAFPPNDPWMAGFSISYYYFGYLMSAMLSMLSGVSSGVGFSMTIALWFALSGLSAYGVGYNLIRSRASSQRPALLAGLLGFIFVLFSGNFQLPLIEMPFRAQSAPAAYFDFWQVQGYLDVEDSFQENSALTLSTPLTNPTDWNQGWWWWHTSRILVDYDLNGNPTRTQPIDEVPAFSFILMDVHPHVLALPFVLMTIGLALNLVLKWRAPNRYEILLYGLTIGGLVFLNTWDGPIYLVILAGAEALRRLMRHGIGRLYIEDWLGLITFGVKLLIIAVLAYLPFLIGFRSQAGGILPNLINPTLFRQYFIMFGPVLLLSLSLLTVELWRGSRQNRMNWKLGWRVAAGIAGAVLFLFLFLIIVSAIVPSIQAQVSSLVQQYGGWGVVLPLLLQRRLSFIVLTLVLLAILAAVVARLFPKHHSKIAMMDDEAITYPPAAGFALLLIAAAAGLTLIPEFVYLRDNFGVRINTVFKFYYQAWVLFSIAGVYGIYTILVEVERPRPVLALRYAFVVMLAFILIAGVAFPVFAAYSRAILEPGRLTQPPEEQRKLALDGRANSLPPGYYESVLCLGNHVQGDDAVVVEASRDIYNSPYGRVGAFTGIPTVINWEHHESQWRGPTYNDVAGSRRPDVDTLYRDLRWDVAQEIIARYDVDYIVYGPTERAQYGAAGEDKFLEHLQPICTSDSTTIYKVGVDTVVLNAP